MGINDVIQSKIDRLISIRLTKGIQPSDIANNILFSDYKSINFSKNEDYIFGQLIFDEVIEGKNQETVLKYTYNHEMILLRIEEQIGNVSKIEWDRNIIEHELINDIINMLIEYYTKNQIEEFIKTLPYDLKNQIEDAWVNVA